MAGYEEGRTLDRGATLLTVEQRMIAGERAGNDESITRFPDKREWDKVASPWQIVFR